MEDFGAIIRRNRKLNGWTIKEFIKNLNFKISIPYVTKIEKYGEIPNPELIVDMAKALELNSAEMLNIARRSKVDQYKKQLDTKYDREGKQ